MLRMNLQLGENKQYKESDEKKPKRNGKDFLELIPEFDPNNEEDWNPAFIDGVQVRAAKEEYDETAEEEKGSLDQDFEIIDTAPKK